MRLAWRGPAALDGESGQVGHGRRRGGAQVGALGPGLPPTTPVPLLTPLAPLRTARHLAAETGTLGTAVTTRRQAVTTPKVDVFTGIK